MNRPHGAVNALQVVQALLEAGANPDVVSSEGGGTALHDAAWHGRLDIVQVGREGWGQCFF
jgi:ankyrin repeat protein